MRLAKGTHWRTEYLLPDFCNGDFNSICSHGHLHNGCQSLRVGGNGSLRTVLVSLA